MTVNSQGMAPSGVAMAVDASMVRRLCILTNWAEPWGQSIMWGAVERVFP